MDNMCKFKILRITHKIIILIKPIYLNKLINEELMRNTPLLQYSNLFSKPKIHLIRIGKRSFSWAAPTMWNSIPKSLRRIRSHVEFKNKLRIFFN